MSAVAEKKEQPKSELVVESGPYSKRTAEVAAPGAQPTNLMQALAVAAANPAMDRTPSGQRQGVPLSWCKRIPPAGELGIVDEKHDEEIAA